MDKGIWKPTYRELINTIRCKMPGVLPATIIQARNLKTRVLENIDEFKGKEDTDAENIRMDKEKVNVEKTRVDIGNMNIGNMTVNVDKSVDNSGKTTASVEKSTGNSINAIKNDIGGSAAAGIKPIEALEKIYSRYLA